MKIGIYFEIEVDRPFTTNVHWTPSYMRWMTPSGQIEFRRVTSHLRTGHLDNDIRADYNYGLLKRVMRLP